MNSTSLKDEKGKFYWTLYDNAMFYPAMEMSCQRVKYVRELEYWYTGYWSTLILEYWYTGTESIREVIILPKYHVARQKTIRTRAIQPFLLCHGTMVPASEASEELEKRLFTIQNLFFISCHNFASNSLFLSSSFQLERED